MTKKQIIYLSGPEGNAFYLLGLASKLAKQLNLDGNSILTEMKTSDYQNLISVMKKYFSNYVTLKP